MRANDESRFAQEIMTYLAEHPEAQDTLDGIVQWWLMDAKMRYQEKNVKSALIDLVKQGYIQERKPERRAKHNPAKSRTIYCLNKRKEGVQELVKRHRPERKGRESFA